MAARTLQAHAQQSVAGYIRDIVQDRRPLTFHIALVVFIDPQPQKTNADESIWVIWPELIGRELLHEKSIVWLVLVETANDIVPKSPRIRPERVRFIAVGFSVAHQIQPLPGQFFAIKRIGQQLINHLFIGAPRSVAHETLYFLNCGGKPDDIIVSSANQSAAIRFRRRG